MSIIRWIVQNITPLRLPNHYFNAIIRNSRDRVKDDFELKKFDCIITILNMHCLTYFFLCKFVLLLSRFAMRSLYERNVRNVWEKTVYNYYTSRCGRLLRPRPRQLEMLRCSSGISRFPDVKIPVVIPWYKYDVLWHVFMFSYA